jgi:UDP-GlcNAc:undecaprenyl-phosphate GlcNAc-1-phosphate transferase
MILAPLFTAFGLTGFFSLLVLKFFPKFGLMDRPEAYGHKRAAVPYPGGVAMAASVLLCILIFLPLDALVRSVLMGSILLSVTSFIDDRRGLSPYLRLGVQLLVAVILVLGGIGISSVSNPFGDPLILDTVNLPFQIGTWSFVFTVFADLVTVVWVVVMVNAFNWIDGAPGMTSSVSAVSAFILLMLSTRPDFHMVDQTVAITLSAIILGMSVAFLIFDFPPAKMLGGDTSSMLLGFLLAVTAIVSGGKIATTVLVLGFPILDFMWVIGRRVLSGQSPFKGDLGHFHHRLMRAGFSQRGVVIFFASTAAIFGGLSLMLQTEGKTLTFAAIGFLMLMLTGILYSRK